MKKLLFLIALALSFAACDSVEKTTIITKANTLKIITRQLPPLDETAEVSVYDIGDTVPKHSEILGGIAVFPEETGLRPYFGSLKKDWETMLERAKKTARELGGNGLEIQLHSYPAAPGPQLSAFVLNVNDSIKPSEDSVFEKDDFNDYVVLNESDTIPCRFYDETYNYLQFVWGYNRNGYRKTKTLPKSDLLSYHIENPTTINETREKHYNSFKFAFAIDEGFSSGVATDRHFYDVLYHRGWAGSANVRFNFYQGLTFGMHYCIHHLTSEKVYQYNFQSNINYIAGSFGCLIPAFSKRDYLDYYLDGACDLSKYRIASYSSLNILIGYYYWENEDDHSINTDALGLGFYFGRDYLVTKHLGIGFSLGNTIRIPFNTKNSEYMPIENKDPIIKFDLTAGLRYYL